MSHDPVQTAVSSLRDPNVLLDHVCDAWRAANVPLDVRTADIIQVHYKPTVRARLIVEVTAAQAGAADTTITQYLFVQVYPTTEQARQRMKAAGNKHDLKCVGPAVFLLRDRAVAWSLPNGPRLRSAKIGFRRKKLRRFLRKIAVKRGLPRDAIPKRLPPPQLVRYVPRRRALFRLEPIPQLADTPLYIKIYEANTYATAKLNLQAVLRVAPQLEFAPPQRVGSNKRRRAIVMKALHGRSFTAFVNDGATEPYERVGRAIASLHNADIEPSICASASDELLALGEAMDDVKLAIPDLAERIDETVAELARRLPANLTDDRVPIHGNLFGDQLLIADGQVGLVDWDDLSRGDPMFDLGRLLAHLRFLAIRQPRHEGTIRNGAADLIAAYRSCRGIEIARVRLEWHAQVALLMRAKISSLRPLPNTWIEDLTRTVTFTHDSLTSGLDWMPAR